MICPKCGGKNCTIISETNSQGYDFLNGCCCYMILGPLGLLCGACGMGSSSTNYWICNDCGNKFQLNDKQIEKVSDEIKLHREIESYPLNLKFSNDLKEEELENENVVIKNFIRKFTNDYDELSEITKKRMIYSMPKENSDNELRIKKIIYDSIGENRNFIANNEKILFMYDNSDDLKGQSGFIVTEKNVYSKDGLNHIKNKMIKSESLIEEDNHGSLMIDGLPMRLNSKSSRDVDVLLNILIESFRTDYTKEEFNIDFGSKENGSNEILKGHILNYKNQIFYCDKEDKNNPAIYRIDKGEKPVQIYKSKNEISNLEIVDDTLYFIEEKFIQGAEIKFIELRGSQNGILKSKVKKSAKIFNEKLYYSVNKGELICMDLKTKQEVILSQDLKSEFAIWNENIYYLNKHDSTLYRMKTDGTEIKRIYFNDIRNVKTLVEDNGDVYYQKDNSIYKIAGNVSEEILRCKKIEQAIVKNGYAIFIAKKLEYLINNKENKIFDDENNALYIADIKNGIVKVLTYENCHNIYVMENKIFLKANNMQDFSFNYEYGINCIIDPNNMKKAYLKDGIL